MGLLDFLKEIIGIDPGSEHLRIVKDRELVFNEPSKISVDGTSVIITGLGSSIRPTNNDVIIKPVDYVITDFQGFEMLLRGAISKGLNLKSKILPRVYIIYYSIPTSSTETEKRAYRDSAEHVGAVEVHMILQICCSAVGMNLLLEQKHFILVDFGASKIEITVFANSFPIAVGIIKMGTAKMIRLVKNFLSRQYKLNVSNNEVELILTTLNTTQLDNDFQVQHTNVRTQEIQDVLSHLFALVNDEFIETIERVSGHADIGKVITNGIYFTGGGSAIDFLREQISLDHGIKRTISKNALLDNINGLMRIMANREKFKNYIMF